MARRSKSGVVIDASSADAANMKALTRTDRQVSKILHTVAHGAVYVFDVKAGEWQKRDVEGAMFLVERNASPAHRVIVMNKLNRGNLLLNMVPGMQAEVKGNLVILTFPEDTGIPVHGLWSGEDSDCEALVRSIAAVMEPAQEAPAASAPAPAAAPAEPAPATPGKGGKGKKNTRNGHAPAAASPAASPSAGSASRPGGRAEATAASPPGSALMESGAGVAAEMAEAVLAPAPAAAAHAASASGADAPGTGAEGVDRTGQGVDRGALKAALLELFAQESVISQLAEAYDRAVARRAAAADSPRKGGAGGKGKRRNRAQAKKA